MSRISVNLKRFKSLVWGCALGALLASNPLYAVGQEEKSASFKPVTSAVMEATGAWEYRLDTAGGRWLAYYDKNRLLRLLDPEGLERLLVPEGRAQAPSGLAIAASSKGAIALWRDKHPAKGLYLLDTESLAADTATIKPLEIGGDTEPLARFLADTDDSGRTHLLWYGEKSGQPTGEVHNLYYRNLNRATQELSPTELVMAGIYPVMATDAKGNLIAFSWRSSGETKQIVSRFRSAETASGSSASSFNDLVEIAEVPEVTPIFQAFHSGSRWFAVWLGQYGADRRDFRLEGVRSDDNGRTWTRFSFDDLRGFDISSLQLAANDEGHILIAVSGRDRRTNDKAKQDVYLIRSADRGDSWSKAAPLRARADAGDGREDPLALFHARNPSVAFGGKPGQVLVVWEDWREIRSGLFASLSNDYGQTWALSDVPLPRPRGINLGLRYEPNAVYASGDTFHVIAEQYTDDSLESKQLIQLDIGGEALADLADAAKARRSQEMETREDVLRKRAEEYWSAMTQADFTKAYAYLDPFFRARMPLNIYLSNMGKIKYSEAKVDSIKIKGPIAEVITTIRASVPEFKVPTTGEIVSQPEREVPVTNRWLWLDGEWVSEFVIESQDIVFTRY
ncbi:hypothetical protein CKO27_14680 [Thiocystis violacea]|nr:hypothetical protein [Thiocystis violacea]